MSRSSTSLPSNTLSYIDCGTSFTASLSVAISAMISMNSAKVPLPFLSYLEEPIALLLLGLEDGAFLLGVRELLLRSLADRAACAAAPAREAMALYRTDSRAVRRSVALVGERLQPCLFTSL